MQLLAPVAGVLVVGGRGSRGCGSRPLAWRGGRRRGRGALAFAVARTALVLLALGPAARLIVARALLGGAARFLLGTAARLLLLDAAAVLRLEPLALAGAALVLFPLGAAARLIIASPLLGDTASLLLRAAASASRRR